MKVFKFEANIRKHQGQDAAYVEFPYNVISEFGRSRIKVKVEFDGVPYRGLLVKMNSPKHCIGVTKTIRKQIGKNPGDSVSVVLQEDKEERVVEIPERLATILESNPEIKEYFLSLSYTHKKEYVEWLTSAKKEETTEKRFNKIIEMLESKIKHP